MFLGVSMGALNEGHLEVELENGVKAGGPNPIEVGFEKEPETLAIEDAVRVLLQGLGEDANREGLRKTPFRVAKALREGTKGYKQKVKDIVQGALFPEAGLENRLGQAGGVGGLVIVRDLDLFSYCESCLLPFQVKCHVGYVPSGQRVVGLSKLSRAADVFAKRLQEPERLAREICSALQQGIKPKGVAIVLQCRHIHFPDFESAVLESNHSGFAEISVSSRSGIFRNDETNNNLWDDFMNLLKFRDEIEISNCVDRNWCPSRCFSTAGPGNSAMMMTNAITSIIRSLGEDPSREELVQTPIRFVKWMMNFKNSNLEMNLRLNPLRSDGGEERMESELNLSFWSQCEHHLLPFYGFVHIGYFSGEGLTNRIGGKSLLQTIVHFYGFKLQVQERLTRQIAEAVAAVLGGDVVVVVEANHTCMISRGIEKIGSSTATIAVLGRFSSDSSARSMFLKSIPNFSSSSSSSSTGV